jgi:hypothetical protein
VAANTVVVAPAAIATEAGAVIAALLDDITTVAGVPGDGLTVTVQFVELPGPNVAGEQVKLVTIGSGITVTTDV